MAAPSGNYNRVGNFSDNDSSAGLKSMHKGAVSPNAKRKMRNAIDWLIAAAKQKYVYSKTTKRFHPWKLSFLTLTLPTQGKLSDIEIKSILNSFLTLAKYNYGLHSYLWKAEPQRRGEIHFHITSDCYMWKNSVRFEWNRLLRKKGLLNGHSDPPTTKIHSTYRVQNMAAYLCKYFTKDQIFAKAPYKRIFFDSLNIATRAKQEAYIVDFQNLFYTRPISGRLWGCSHTLSAASSVAYIVDTAEMRSMNYDIRKSCIREKTQTFCNYFQIDDLFYQSLPNGRVKLDYYAQLKKIRKPTNANQIEIYNSEGNQITEHRVLNQFHKKFSQEKLIFKYD